MLAALALVACKKDDKKGQEPAPDAITLISEAVVSVGEESEIITVKFSSNVDWTAAAEGEFIALKENSGKAGENIELKVTVQSIPEGEIGRIGGIYLSGGNAEVVGVVIMQGKVFTILPAELKVGIEGGKAEFQVITNLDYEVKIYDSFDWAPAVFDKETGKGSFTVAANEGYDARSAYVKFTVPDIQDQAYDDEGAPIDGETVDHVERIYVDQAGLAEIAWKTYLPENFNVTSVEGIDATATIALFNGKLLVSDATKIYTVDPATGAFNGTLEVGTLPVQSIANDDAGNLLFANLGVYGVEAPFFEVYAVKADDTSLSAPVHLIHCVVDAWAGSHGIDKVAARGNVFDDGVVSAIYGGLPAYEGVSYAPYWAIVDGKANEAGYNEWNPTASQPDGGWFQTPSGAGDLWLSNRGVVVPAGTSVSEGFFYGGYDNLYNVYYSAGKGSDWTIAVPGAGDWGGGPVGMHTTSWGGKKILAFIQLGYTWNEEGWGMPSYLWLVDYTDPSNGSLLSKTQMYNGLEQPVTGGTEESTADVLPVVSGNDLAVYFVDSSQGHIGKMLFPKL